MFWTPSPSSPAWLHNLTATPSTTNSGTRITTGGTAHVKTAYTQVFASTTYPAAGFWLLVNGTVLAASACHFLLDVAVGGAGSETVILPNYTAGWKGAHGIGAHCMYIPLAIPVGSRVSIRAQSNLASDTIDVNLWLVPAGQVPANMSFLGCDTAGVILGNSSGTAVTAGNSGAEGTAVQFTLTSGRRYGAVLLGIHGGNTALMALCYHFELLNRDSGGNFVVLGEYHLTTTTAEVLLGPFPCAPIYTTFQPDGSWNVAVRGECSGTSQAMECVVYGFY